MLLHNNSASLKEHIKMKSCPVHPIGLSKELHHNINVIAISGLVSASLSLIGSASIVGFIIWNKLVKYEPIQPLFHLSMSDFILSVLWITSTVQYLFSATPEMEYPLYTAVSCFVWQLLTEVAHLVTFFLTINYAVHVYLKMRYRTIQVFMGITEENTDIWKWCKKLLYILSWCLPIILMMPIIANIRLENISACQKCVILIDVPTLFCSKVSWDYGYIILALSLTCSIAMIIVLYFCSLRLYWKAVPGFCTDHQRKQLTNMRARVTLYMLVFLICWAPALMISYHKWINHPHPWHSKAYLDVNRFFVLYIFQAICAPLQGLLNSIVYGWSKKTFRGSPTINAVVSHQREVFITPYQEFVSTISSDEVEVSTHVNVSHSSLLGY